MVGGALSFVQEFLEELERKKESICKVPPEDCAIVPVEVWQPSALPPPRPRPAISDARVISYIDHVDSRQQFIENRQDQRVQNITYNFAQPNNGMKTVLLIALGVSLALIIFAAASRPAPPARRSRRLTAAEALG